MSDDKPILKWTVDGERTVEGEWTAEALMKDTIEYFRYKDREMIELVGQLRAEVKQLREQNEYLIERGSVMSACETADSIIHHMMDLFNMETQVYRLDKDRNAICDEEPTGFTKEGRELFEHIYNLVRLDIEEGE